ncbi:MAG: S9 family peptidase [Bacteroidetes bacterium]|nr:MAG: S9 family peptidase [Bacteroidota bacterium]
MRYFLLPVLLVGALQLYSQKPNDTLSVEKIMQDPKWIGTSPGNVFWKPDGTMIYFFWNPEKAPSDSLYGYDVRTKKISKLDYRSAQKELSIKSGSFDQKHERIAFVFNGDIYLLTIQNGKIQRITQTSTGKRTPSFSMHDQWIVFESDQNLYAWDIANGSTRQLTHFINTDSPSTAKLNLQEEWLRLQQTQTSSVIEERKHKRELHDEILKSTKETDTIKNIYVGKKQVEDLAISPDGRFITYNLVELPTNAKETIVPQYVNESGFTAEIPSRTKVGAPQEKSNFYIFDRKNDSIFRMSTDSLPGIFQYPEFLKDYPEKEQKKKAARDAFVLKFSWNQEGILAVADIRSLDFKDRWLMKWDAKLKSLTLVDHQHDEAWIAGPGIGWEDLPSMGWINDHQFYFQSEASGYSHLYTFDLSSGKKKQLTYGNYEIDKLTLSRDKKYFYFISNEDHPGKQQYYKMKTDGTDKEKITGMEGGYEPALSPDEKTFAYRYSYQNIPWELYIQENAPGKKPLQVTQLAMSKEWQSYPWRDPKIFSFTARDGKQVYARIYEPQKNARHSRAAVIFVHGAGYLQNVTFRWSYYFREFMFNNLLADLGYTVMDIDYRASAGYGRDWRTAIYRHMGGKDLDDQVDAARWLVKERGVDSARIGMYGGSYGGFITLMALFTQPKVFKAGAALRPVTDWAHYNHGYAAAILNEPFNDSLAYARSSPINFASGLKSNLLICHGMVDENVHVQDAFRLSQRLIELGKDNWNLAVYPVEDHSFVESSSWADEYKRILKLFESSLNSFF